MLEVISNLSRTKLIALGSSVALVLIFLIFIVMSFSYSNFEPIYTGLEGDDLSEVVKFLDRQGVEYQIAENGVSVKSSEVRSLRMRLASEGIPRNGSIVGYEIFNKPESLGTSSFNQNITILRALEGELARSIMSFDNIKSARVHLVLPKKEVFIRDHGEATASIVLKIRNGVELSKKTVDAIGNLVMTSVNGLKFNNITIVSTDGRSLKSSYDESDNFISNTTEYKFSIEKRMRDVIENLVEKYVGIGGVRAEVSADINFDKEVVNLEKYDPSGKVLRSEHATEEKSNNSSGVGDVSVANNIPNADSNSQGNANNSSFNKIDEVKNYEITKEIRNSVKAFGMIKRLSIAVLVDGIYGKGDEDNNRSYSPRSEEELKKIKNSYFLCYRV